MKALTIEMITSILTGDETVTSEMKDTILRCCRQNVPRRKLILAKEAMEILQISRPTLRNYAQNGTLEQINFSPRKVRFDEAEVRKLACSGIPIE